MSGLKRLVLLAATLIAAPLMAIGAAQAAIETSCGAPIKSVSRTNDVTLLSNATVYERVPGAVIVVTVPAGAQRCIKVLFTGVSACGQSAVGDFCYIRAVDNGNAMNPQIGATEFNSEDATGSSHALSWVKKVGPGSHRIVIQRRVHDPLTIFNLLGWTMDVTLTSP